MKKIIETIEKALAVKDSTIEIQNWQICDLKKKLEEAEKTIRKIKGEKNETV